MAEKLISCNWVDPRQGRQGQQRCWLGMGHRWLSRPGVLVSAGTGVLLAPGAVPAQGCLWGGARAVGQCQVLLCRVSLGFSHGFLCFDGPSASITPCLMGTGIPSAARACSSLFGEGSRSAHIPHFHLQTPKLKCLLTVAT